MYEPTNFSEANALLALQDGDEDSARESIESLLGGELVMLGEAARRLAELVAERIAEMGEAHGRGGG